MEEEAPTIRKKVITTKTMAKNEILWPFIKSYEGGFSDHPADKGGATNMGVTIATWRKQGYDKDGDGDIDVDDLKLISEADAKHIFEINYWNRWKADKIADQSIANLLVDWVWGSGAYGVKIPQRILGVKIDGVVGPKTLAALNAQEPEEFFNKLKQERADYFQRICVNTPSNKVFLKGWLRRLDGIRYGSLKLNAKTETIIEF